MDTPVIIQGYIYFLLWKALQVFPVSEMGGSTRLEYSLSRGGAAGWKESIADEGGRVPGGFRRRW
jgi:hypothetical protein